MQQILYESDVLTLGTFSLAREDPRWRAVNVVERGPVVAFPCSNLVIAHAGREPFLVTPNHVTFYNGGERYRRELRDTAHRCVFVRVTSEFLIDAIGRPQLPFDHGPCAAEAFFAQHVAVRRLEAGGDPALFDVETAIAAALRRVLDDAMRLHRVRRRTRPSTALAHHGLSEAAKLLLVDGVSERRPLGFYARALHTSEFHLARIFRKATGFSLHGYRKQLRVRLALERLASPDADLTALAHSLGFASHSHFTDTFRQVFGVAPSTVRDLGRRDGELRVAGAVP